jgi:hypothetical protein
MVGEIKIERLHFAEGEEIALRPEMGLRIVCATQPRITTLSVNMPRGVTSAGTRPLGLTAR